MEDRAVFVGQDDGTTECVEGFGHPRACDGADIEYITDRHRAPQMRQQQLSKLDLALRDDSLPFVPAETEASVMQWRVQQEEMHNVDCAGWLYELLKIRRCVDIRRGKMARDHMWLVQRG